MVSELLVEPLAGGVAGFGMNVQARLVGRPEQLRLTSLLNPSRDCTTQLVIACWPCVNESVPGLQARLKLGVPSASCQTPCVCGPAIWNWTRPLGCVPGQKLL